MGKVGRRVILISGNIEFKMKTIQQNNKCIMKNWMLQTETFT